MANPVVLYDVNQRPMNVENGVAIPANTQGVLIVGSDGTTARTVRTDASGNILTSTAASGYGGQVEGLAADDTTAVGNPVMVGGLDNVTNKVQSLHVDAFGNLQVTVATTGSIALPRMVNPSFNASEGAVVANAFKRVVTYTVPTGFSGSLIRFASFQGEVAQSRLVAETNIAQFNNNTSVFTAGTPYTSPGWASVVEAEVTTAFASGSGNVVITVTYTNEIGTASRTGTITIPKGSALASRWVLTKQAGDLGVRSIQNITTGTVQVGVIKVLGLLQFAFHDDESTTIQNNSFFNSGAISFSAGTVIGIEYAGGTVSKTRRFDALMQLVVE